MALERARLPASPPFPVRKKRADSNDLPQGKFLTSHLAYRHELVQNEPARVNLLRSKLGCSKKETMSTGVDAGQAAKQPPPSSAEVEAVGVSRGGGLRGPPPCVRRPRSRPSHKPSPAVAGA